MKKGWISEVFVSFQGEGLHVGRRQLFIRLGGCNIRCRYCDTPDSLERTARFRVYNRSEFTEHRNPVTATDLIEMAHPLLDGSLDGTALTGGEPLIQADFLTELLASPELPRPILLESNGMLPEKLLTVLPAIDVVSMDIKLPSNSGEREFWNQHQRFLALSNGKAYVKILIDDGTDPAEVEQAVHLVAETAPSAPVFLQPIENSDGKFALRDTNLEGFFVLARRHLADVRVLPQIHKILRIH